MCVFPARAGVLAALALTWQIVVLIFVFLVPPAFAQQVITNGSLSGRVADPSGAVVPGALVTARQLQTNQSSTTQTDHEGRFRFPSLKVGSYEVVVHLVGFAD